MWDFFQICRWFAWISRKQCWQEEMMGNFSRNVEMVCVDFQKSNAGGRKQWGNFF